MVWRLVLLLVPLLCCAPTISAQINETFRFSGSRSEDSQSDIIEVDTTLFRISPLHRLDSYSQATRYYRAAGSLRRRGLYYTVAEHIVEPSEEYMQSLVQPLPQSEVAIYGAQSSYTLGLRAEHAQMLSSRWSLSSSLWAQTGRDQFVEGVFRNSLSPQITLSRQFEGRHHLAIDASLYYSMRGLQYGATLEAFSLVGSPYYNPSWGFYDGKVRNSRVRRDLSPNISAHYQRPVSEQTTLIVDSSLDYSRQANSSLGWYNATTPMPDYYRKMPSYIADGDAKDYVMNEWRTNHTDYTQINWDEMVRLNSLSADGGALYIQEDRVVRSLSTQVAALLHSQIGERVSLTYGVESSFESSRNFKVMRDLLGASHLVDYDQFLGDNYNKTLPLDNDQQNPDNYIYEGDRFGYDYSQIHSLTNVILRARYNAHHLDLNLESTFGGECFYRVGHFEKERFSSSASFGRSSAVNLSPYTLRLSIGYAHQANKYFAVKLLSSRLSPQSRNLFLNESAANFLAPSLTGELIHSAAISFRLNNPLLSLSGEIYALRSRDGSSVYSLYDDLTSTMCRVSITDIGYCSYGAELTAELRVQSDLNLSATVAAGRYLYDVDPNVELYDDYSLTSISSPTSSRMSGVNIGNAPQITSTLSMAYFGLSRYIFNLSSSYAALRYEQPSMARRSERLLSQAFVNDQSAEAAIEQSRLDDIFDVEISASRYFWFESGGRLSLRLSVKNLLGDNDRVIYAKEPDRITLQSVDGYFSGAEVRESLYQYGSPRRVQLSVSYQF